MPRMTRRNVLSAVAAGLVPLPYRPGRATAQPAPGAGSGLAPSATPPRLHAMIVGINTYSGRTGIRGRDGTMHYQKIRDLRGCVNDAQAIAGAVKPIAATLRVLLDGAVTRASFFATWKQMVALSSPGDILLVTYSGHGSQENGSNGSVATHTADGLHDTFVLSSFDSSGPPLNTERILDDEMQGLWRAVQGRNRVIFVADSCHAGGMTREADSRVAVNYRTPGAYDIEGELSTAVPIPVDAGRLELPHVVFLSGAQHNELVPEIEIEGRWQGALSLSFSRAIAQADTNRDNVITGAELSSYVLRAVRAFSDSAQHPSVRWPQADIRSGLGPDDPLLYLGAPLPNPPASASNTAVRLQLLNVADDTRRDVAGRLQRASIVSPQQAADLTWDGRAGEVIDPLGNIVASGIAAGDLQAVVDRTRLIGMLRTRVGRSGIDMRLLLPGELPSGPPTRESDRRHKKGAHVDLFAAGINLPNYLMFNVGGNGTIQVLESKRNASPAPQDVRFTIEVSQPFGADFLVTIASAQYAPLYGAIERLDQTRDCAALAELLEKNADGTGLRIGMQGVFTSEK